MIVHVVVLTAEANHELLTGVVEVFTDESAATAKMSEVADFLTKQYPDLNWTVSVSPCPVDEPRDLSWALLP